MSNMKGKISDFVLHHHNGCTLVKIGVIIVGISYAFSEGLITAHKNGYICGVEDCKKIAEEAFEKHKLNNEEEGA